jgi:hypothetical protein
VMGDFDSFISSRELLGQAPRGLSSNGTELLGKDTTWSGLQSSGSAHTLSETVGVTRQVSMLGRASTPSCGAPCGYDWRQQDPSNRTPRSAAVISAMGQRADHSHPSRTCWRRAETDLPLAIGLATSCAQSMKSCATGVSVRFFNVTIPTGT